MNPVEENISRVEITERDIQLFQYLNEQKYMIAKQIYDFFWPESTVRTGTGRQRLTKLVERGYIKIREIIGTKFKLFLLTEKGISELRARNLDHGLSEIDIPNPVQVRHTLKLVNIRNVFEKTGNIKWVSERVFRKQESHQKYFPDAVMDYKGLKSAIELENSIKGKQVFLKRLHDYALDKNFDSVIYVVSWTSVLSWLIDVDVPQEKIFYVLYDELIAKKKDSELKNLSGSVKIGELFS